MYKAIMVRLDALFINEAWKESSFKGTSDQIVPTVVHILKISL